jgi:hypothetical protein
MRTRLLCAIVRLAHDRRFDDSGHEVGELSNSAHMRCILTADFALVGSSTDFGEKQTSFGATPVHSTDLQGVAGQYVQAAITARSRLAITTWPFIARTTTATSS